MPPNGLRGGEQYAMSNGQNIPPASSPPESPMDGSQMPPFGITCEPLTADPGPDMPMWSARDSLVNHLASLGSEVPETTCETAGLTPFALLGKHNPDMSGLKTSPAYFPQIPPTANAGRIRGKNGEDSGAYQNTPTPIAARKNGKIKAKFDIVWRSKGRYGKGIKTNGKVITKATDFCVPASS